MQYMSERGEVPIVHRLESSECWLRGCTGLQGDISGSQLSINQKDKLDAVTPMPYSDVTCT